VELCECEPAAGVPHGLGCERDGWFISNFEYQGTWMGRDGLVPLSRAICCRPCLPGELPRPARFGNGTARPVAVVAIGCHPSTGKQFRALNCEAAGSSFVTGKRRRSPRRRQQVGAGPLSLARLRSRSRPGNGGSLFGDSASGSPGRGRDSVCHSAGDRPPLAHVRSR
jgi:hypothetical protein